MSEMVSGIVSIPSLGNWEVIEKTNALVESNQLLDGLNKQLIVADNIAINIGFNNINSMLTFDLNQLVKGVEYTKNEFYNAFASGRYIAVKYLNGMYYVPEKDDDKKVCVKEIFLMSVNGFNWESINYIKLRKEFDIGSKVYLYNQYTNQIFGLTREMGLEIIDILDAKLPLRMIKIAGLMGERVSLDEINGYIASLEANEKKRQEEIAFAEEQRRKTYKGIVFDTEELKDEAIKTEEELQVYCSNLVDKNFDELWDKKEETSKLPGAIFSSYVYQLLAAMQNRENIEINQYIEKINMAELSDLDMLSASYNKHKYSDNARRFLDDALYKRSLVCQRVILDGLTSGIDNLDRKALAALIVDIKEKHYDAALTQEFVDKINRQNDVLEMQELRDLCANIETQSIAELDVLKENIKKNNYQPRHTDNYFRMIENRVDYIHVKNMETYCETLSNADRNSVIAIEGKIKAEDCKAELKEKFFSLIKERNERLDYEDLCKLTKDIKDKSLVEQEQLYKQLQTGRYNDKFIKEFLLLARMCIEKSQLANIDNKLIGIEKMTRIQVSALKAELENGNYEDRIVKQAMLTIAERSYELDMYELMEMRNSFDDLSLYDIQDLRNRIKQKNLSARACALYDRKLKDRELQIGYEKVGQASYLSKQIIEQSGLFDAGIALAIFSPNYLMGLNKHFQMIGAEDYEDIPFLIFPECNDLAVTKNYIYFTSMSGYVRFKLSEIIAFNIASKMFKDNLVITFTNGRFETLSDGLNKNISQIIANALGLICQNVRNENMLAQYPLYKNHIPELTNKDFEFMPVPMINEQFIIDLFVNELHKENANMRNSYVKYRGISNWENLENKVRYGMEIMNDQIVCYYDSSMLGGAKEGFALGLRNIYVKNNHQMLISIPYNDIYDVVLSEGKLVFVAKNNNIFNASFVGMDANLNNKFADIVLQYVKGMQLMSKEQSSQSVVQKPVEQPPVAPQPTVPPVAPQPTVPLVAPQPTVAPQPVVQQPTVQPPVEEQLVCPQCGTVAKMAGARFCRKCGSKL